MCDKSAALSFLVMLLSRPHGRACALPASSQRFQHRTVPGSSATGARRSADPARYSTSGFPSAVFILRSLHVAYLPPSNPARVGFRVNIFHVARRGPSDALAAVPGDDAQSHVDARRDAGRSQDVLLLHHVQITHHGDGRKGFGQAVQRTPVRGGATPVE